MESDDLWSRIQQQNADIDQQVEEAQLRDRQRDASELLTLDGSRKTWVWADAAAATAATAPSVRVAPSAFGLGLFAARPVAAGEVVLREAPAFSASPSEAAPDLLQGLRDANSAGADAEGFLLGVVAAVLALWLRSDEATRSDLIGSFFCTPDAGDLLQYLESLVADVQRLYPPLAASSVHDVAQVLSVWLLSSHNLSSGSVDWSDGAALFRVAHRANHSCDPNIAYRYEAPGHLVYRALRPITAGEPLCFSYLFSHELLMPSFLRRRVLEARKHFRCACSRCASAADAGRALPCDECAAKCAPAPCSKPCSRAYRGGSAGVGDDANSWERCAICGSGAVPSAAAFAREEELCAQAISQHPLSAEEQIRELEQHAGWHGHWVWASALWRCGLHLLRDGVLQADEARARLGWPLLQAYVRWADEHVGVASRHYLSSQMAEIFACLSAFVSGTQDESAAALAVQLCAPFLRALENEYGVDDEDCVRMRRFFLHHCGRCGKRAPRSVCSRCHKVAYCSSGCQRAAWAEHKRWCVKV